MLPMLLLGTFLTSSMLVCDTERKSIKVSLSTSTKRPGANRDLSPDVKVYYYPEEDLLELTCYETKNMLIFRLTFRFGKGKETKEIRDNTRYDNEILDKRGLL